MFANIVKNCDGWKRSCHPWRFQSYFVRESHLSLSMATATQSPPVILTLCLQLWSTHSPTLLRFIWDVKCVHWFLFPYLWLCVHRGKKKSKELRTSDATESSHWCHRVERQDEWAWEEIKGNDMFIFSKKSSERVHGDSKRWTNCILKVDELYFPASLEL